MRTGTSRFSRFSRLIVFAPAALIAFSTPASADTYTENFDDDSYDLFVQLGSGAYWCDQYSNQYGTEGPSLCLFSTQSATEFVFPVPVQGFQFVAGAKNGTSQLTLSYTDGTTEDKPIDGTCCETTVLVTANEGMAIERFSLPADADLWLFDSLSWWGETESSTSTSSTELPPEEPETTTTESTSTTTSSTTSSSTTMPPPPATEPVVETVAPTTTYYETTVPTTVLPTTLPPATTVAPTTTVAATTTLEPTTTVVSPETTITAPVVDETVPPVSPTALEEMPPENASYEAKQEFEAQVNIYSGEYDDYVPAGSTITVAERRTIVAVTAVAIMFAPPPSNVRRRR